MRHRPAILLPLVLGLATLILLVPVADVDPATTVTESNSPFTDEGYDVVNARNLVLLGDWSTDDWNLHLVNLPFSIVTAGVFALTGVGIVQARLIAIVAVALTVLLLAAGLRRPLGAIPAAIAGIAYGTCALVLYYGRLAYLEPFVALALVAGAVLVSRATRADAARWGLLAGFAFAIAAGTKPNALLTVAGGLAGLGIAGGLIAGPRTVLARVRDRAGAAAGVARWIAAAAVAILASGLAWLIVVALPRFDAVLVDFRIWPRQRPPLSVGALLERLASYPTDNDGALALLGPSLAAGLVGAVLAVVFRRRLSTEGRLVVGLAIGWLAVGWLAVILAPYRPNRYLLPVVPAQAILLAAGCAAIAAEASARGWRERRTYRRLFVAAAVTVTGLVAIPGLAAHGSWMTGGTRTLPGIQAALAEVLPDGAVLEGRYGPTLAMRAPVVTISSNANRRVNGGDLYLSRGVRWILDRPDWTPAWATAHAAEWAGRREEHCVIWGSDRARVCLVRLP